MPVDLDIRNGQSEAISWSGLVEENDDDPVDVMMMELDKAPVSAAEVKKWSRHDSVIGNVIDVVQKGWISQEYPAEWKPFESRKEELSIIDGYLMWGSRVVIPSQGRERVLEELHQCHPGINRMNSLARSYVWWPCLDKDIEKKVLHCHTCQSNQHSPSKAPLYPWEWPKDPWRHLHIDYAGPFKNCMFLVVIDAHFNWLKVIPTTSTTGQVTVNKLRQIFATHGIPEPCVMDNGPAFVSKDFAVFMHRNGIRHITTAPYHPASNGQAKRAVQIFKRGLEKMNANDLLESLQ